ncbi:MAG: hypothetical protein JHD28_04795 [Bacteroidia bacterium]|nr:hypothetical protein [Bacteroidia bacterium]
MKYKLELKQNPVAAKIAIKLSGSTGDPILNWYFEDYLSTQEFNVEITGPGASKLYEAGGTKTFKIVDGVLNLQVLPADNPTVLNPLEATIIIKDPTKGNAYYLPIYLVNGGAYYYDLILSKGTSPLNANDLFFPTFSDDKIIDVKKSNLNTSLQTIVTIPKNTISSPIQSPIGFYTHASPDFKSLSKVIGGYGLYNPFFGSVIDKNGTDLGYKKFEPIAALIADENKKKSTFTNTSSSPFKVKFYLEKGMEYQTIAGQYGNIDLNTPLKLYEAEFSNKTRKEVANTKVKEDAGGLYAEFELNQITSGTTYYVVHDPLDVIQNYRNHPIKIRGTQIGNNTYKDVKYFPPLNIEVRRGGQNGAIINYYTLLSPQEENDLIIPDAGKIWVTITSDAWWNTQKVLFNALIDERESSIDLTIDNPTYTIDATIKGECPNKTSIAPSAAIWYKTDKPYVCYRPLGQVINGKIMIGSNTIQRGSTYKLKTSIDNTLREVSVTIPMEGNSAKIDTVFKFDASASFCK